MIIIHTNKCKTLHSIKINIIKFIVIYTGSKETYIQSIEKTLSECKSPRFAK